MHLLPNELIWLLFLLFDMLAVVAVYRFFGREGLMGYVVLAIITCNIEVVKLVDMFGFTVTLGNILYGSLFLTSDILAEIHGRRTANKAVLLGFAAMLLMTAFMQISLVMRPSQFDAAHPHLQAVFSLMPRVAFGSLCAYLLSQLFDIWAFLHIKRLTEGRALWFRNNVATFISQAIDTVLFSLLALAPLPILGTVPGFESWSTIWTVAWTAYVLKLIVAVVDTPFVYWARAISRRRDDAPERVELNSAPA
jgi:uncharacterized integral membrane protein (TIGR00697 family)